MALFFPYSWEKMYRKKLVQWACLDFKIWEKFVRVTRRIFEICTYIRILGGFLSLSLSLTFNGSLIKFESSVKSLGVIIDSKMDWKQQVATICKRSNPLMYRLNFFRKFTTFRLRKHLIESLLFPLIDYCSLVICNISDELELKLLRVINSGVRYIFGIRKCEHISAYRVSLNWLTTKNRRNYFAGVLMYKLFQSKTPTYLADRYIANTSTRPVRGYRLPLNIPPFTKEFLENSFYVTSSYLWNSLPPEVRCCDTLYSFKKVLFKHLLSLEHQSMPSLRAHL